MKFPKDATSEERNFNWNKIAEIKDAAFGFERVDEKPTGVRFSTRCVLFNDKKEICMVRSAKYGYIQIPGGGIDEGESIEDGLKREVQEEVGWEIESFEPVGYTHEHRESEYHRYLKHWSEGIAFVFVAKPGKNVGTNYMEDEKEEGFEPVWMPFDEALDFLKSRVGKVEAYSGNFANMRDYQILKFIKKSNIC